MALHSKGIRAAFLGSTQPQHDKVIQSLKDGQIIVLYASPEFVIKNSDELKACLGDPKKVCIIIKIQ